MQVLVTLADARGGVVTRDKLISECWNGLIVGDDAINRAISGIRRALRNAGTEVAIETVPKIGYRLLGVPENSAQGTMAGMPRRSVLIASGGVALAVAGVGAWHLATGGRDARVADLIERGRIALRDQLPDQTQQGIGFFTEALRLAPDDAEAWGNLALAWRNVSEYAPSDEIAGAVAASETAAGRALAINPEQPEAHAAQALLPPIYGDWLEAEQRLRGVHTRFPDQPAILGELALLMFSVGRAMEAAEFSARAVQVEPLSPIYQYRRTYHLWTTGRSNGAEQAIDRAVQLWPTHPAVWFARFLLFAGTDRYEAALQMLTTPIADDIMGPTADAWRATCSAILHGSAAERAAAAKLNMELARSNGAACVSAILALNRLRAIDEAFVVAEGYLLRRGPLVTEIGSTNAPVNDQRWRKTMMLFVPATAPMRADLRFESLCADIGLADYWRESRTEPYFRRRTAPASAM